ncbi:putative capsid protein [Feline stool-associated circular virus KU8]|nr:putative capsid protein [Feline stool-associated circular virus KU8]
MGMGRRRYYRRRYVSRPPRRRMTYRRYSRRYCRTKRAPKGTYSSVVTLTQDAEWRFSNQNASNRWVAFTFSPVSVPGFLDYKGTYSHFRILKGKLYLSRALGNDAGTTFNYLVVGSRPFAATQNARTTTGQDALMPAQTEEALRQAKWQRVRYPSTNTNVVPVGFHPYAIVQTFGPTPYTTGSDMMWQRIWEGRRWMPFSWAAATGSALSFFGPYLVVDKSNGELSQGSWSVQCTLKISVQFKGQR